MKILITGAGGQLASEFILALQGQEISAFSKEQMDVSNLNDVLDAVSQCGPDAVLNCAAYNLVDEAEKDFETASRVNAEGVKNLAAACKRYNALLVHYSTDYVFDGEKHGFYTEEDEPNPINKYGESKLLGERFLREETDDFLLFRVSWVFGQGKENFLYRLSKWAGENKVLKIVCDQVSVPTYTEDIVRYTMLAIDKGLRGMYHLTNSGYASRYEAARYFLEKLGFDNLILPVNSDCFSLPAKRPYFSAMSNKMLSCELGQIPDWRDGIERFVRRWKNK